MSDISGERITLHLSHVWKFFLVGIVFHLLYILSIFDIYFRTPLVQNLPAVAPVQPAPATRLVLFVSDGMRADTAFEMNEMGEPRAPFLRQMAREGGVWGVSHARVPTESRPGHVAMIAGFWEDVSAITQGWKKNAVEFDHTLRRAKYAYSMGVWDIVELFDGPQVHMMHYATENVDFASDAKQLDRWSFDRLRETFELASVDDKVKMRLDSDQLVIFVHLLGCDTNGHAHYPKSRQYHENVSFVDEGIRQSVAMIDEYYGNDGKTAYIFTSDHGMSDGGSHGDGDPDNTRCPFVAWGAGIDGPQASIGNEEDDWSRPFKMGDIHRRDLEQADITPFMASLVGISIPTNSEGFLPSHLLASTDATFKAKAALNNLRQLFTTLQAKEAIRSRNEPFFQPFKHTASDIGRHVDKIQALIDEEKLGSAMEQIVPLREKIFAGLQYYQKYDWLMLRSVVALGYVGWMVHGMLFLARHSITSAGGKKGPSLFIMGGTGLLALVALYYLYCKAAPIQYYFYFVFPLLFWHLSLSDLRSYGPTAFIQVLNLRRIWRGMLLYMLGMAALVYSFFQRSTLGLLVPPVALGTIALLQRVSFSRQVLLFIFSMAVALFPRLDPIRRPDPLLLYSGSCTLILVSLLLLILCRQALHYKTLVVMRLALTGAASLVTYRSDMLFASGAGVPQIMKLAAWLLVGYSLLSPFVMTQFAMHPFERLFDIYLALAPAYLILSISSVAVDPLMLFLAFKFSCYLILAFFGTGNFASISSFSLPSVYRLITTFAPFIMAILLFVKLLLPILFLAIIFGAILRLLHVQPPLIFLLIISTIDMMTLAFFFLVRDQGSWLEIGTSISNFILASVFSLAALIMFLLSQALLHGVIFPVPSKPLTKIN